MLDPSLPSPLPRLPPARPQCPVHAGLPVETPKPKKPVVFSLGKARA